MSDLPVNIDATYADDGGDPSVKAHQEHHDALHELHNNLAGATPDPAAVPAIEAHRTDTTNVHGIADTAALLDSGDIGVTVQGYDPDLAALAAAGNGAVLAATTASFTTADESKLDGIETGATADMTPAEILAAVKTVDGAGSGLDADLLDGQSSATFQSASAIAANGKGVVNHGSTAGTARPSGFASVEWYGSVAPTNAVDGDTWVRTS